MENSNTANKYICAIQMSPVLGNKHQNRIISDRLVREAAEKGASLVILPELSNTGYCIPSKDKLLSLAELVSGETVSHWAALAKELNIYIIGGFAELGEDQISCYNSAAIVGPNGYIGRYRKLHLWGNEKTLFEPGNEGLPVFRLPYFRIGVLICYDVWFPETFRILALQGADMVCCCCNFVDHSPLVPSSMGIIQAMANANANRLFVAVSNRVGRECDTVFSGRSAILAPNGRPIAESYISEREDLVFADIDYRLSRSIHSGKYNAIIFDRRTDVYSEKLGANIDIFPR